MVAKADAFKLGVMFANGASQAEMLKMAEETPAPEPVKAVAADLEPVSDTIVPLLNKLLSSELAAMHQYQVHYQMAENWGYTALVAKIKDRYEDEHKHAGRLIARILLLGGKPVVDSLDAIHIGATIQTAFEIDLQSELTAIRDYNAGIKKVTEAGDATTRKMLEEIVDEEETDHADELTSFLDQIKQMGLGPFLVQQVK